MLILVPIIVINTVFGIIWQVRLNKNGGLVAESSDPTPTETEGEETTVAATPVAPVASSGSHDNGFIAKEKYMVEGLILIMIPISVFIFVMIVLIKLLCFYIAGDKKRRGASGVGGSMGLQDGGTGSRNYG